MSHIAHDRIALGEARIVEQPEAAQAGPAHSVDQTFGLPAALYKASVALYLGFLVVTGTAFASPGLAIPMAIFVLFIVAGFGLPAMWTRLASNVPDAPTLGEFAQRGIMTSTGRLAPRDAAVQMLILPVLLVVWGLAIAVIAAIVA